MDEVNRREIGHRPAERASDSGGENTRRTDRVPEFEFGRLRVPNDAIHRLLLRAGKGGSY